MPTSNINIFFHMYCKLKVCLLLSIYIYSALIKLYICV